MKKRLQNYKSSIPPVWCRGCGDYALLRSMEMALAELNIEPHDIIMVSGIGCSGRFSHYFNTYSLHGTHGRVLPTAMGAKLARPEMTIFGIGGDGDGLGIGGGHIPHAARKNVNITYILVDNEIYGLTKGQASPSTPLGTKTKTTPFGVSEKPIDAIPILLAYDISFVARVASNQMKDTTNIIKEAITHKGMSLVYSLSPCQTFPSFTSKQLKENTKTLPEDHDRENKMAALEKAYSKTPLYTGIFYQINKPGIDDDLNMQIEQFQLPSEISDNPIKSMHTLLQTFS